MFELLAGDRRRLVLYELRDVDHVELEELATTVAARENDVAVEDVTDEQVERVKVSLHHNELPRLHDAHLIDYDYRQGDVNAGDLFSTVEKYLALAAEDESAG